MSSEFSGPSVRYGGCSYSRLSNYNQGMPESSPPIEAGTPSMSTTIVPAYCPTGNGPLYPPGYNTLQHEQEQPSCNGYFNILSAYPFAASGTCAATFVKRDCSMPNACK